MGSDNQSLQPPQRHDQAARRRRLVIRGGPIPPPAPSKPGSSRRRPIILDSAEEGRSVAGSSASKEVAGIIAASDDWRGEKLAEVRAIVLTADPAVVEEVKWKKPSRPEGVPVWSYGGIICTGEMLKSAVRLTF